MKKITFGVIVGNRGFFPDALAKEGRKNIMAVLRENGYNAVALKLNDTKFGAVETYGEAKQCAALFAQNAGKIDGLIVTLPNFGDEKGVAEAIKQSGLQCPILIHAEQDDQANMVMGARRDSFCSKISVCNNLVQAGIPFTLTSQHTLAVTSKAFQQDLARFAATCRILRGLKNVRFGAIGSRPAAFNTVRYSEKILEMAGIAVEPIDLYEILGWVDRLDAKDRKVKAKLKAIQAYTDCAAIPEAALLKMAKFGAVWTAGPRRTN